MRYAALNSVKILGVILQSRLKFKILLFLKPSKTYQFLHEDLIWEKDDDEEKVKDIQKTYSQKLFEALNFIPLADILAGDQLFLKKEAIDKIAQLGTSQALHLLVSYKNHPSREVRSFISSALSQVNKNYEEQIEAARMETGKDNYKVSSLIFLAKIYLRYARSGLLDTAQSRHYENEALKHLQTCAQSDYANKSAFITLIDIYLAHGQWEEALDTIQHLERIGKADNQEILSAKINYYFKTKNLPEAIGHLALLKKEKNIGPEWFAAASWWGVYP